MQKYIHKLLDLNKKIIIKSYNNWYAILNNNNIILYNSNNNNISSYKILLDDLLKLIKDNDKIKIKYSLYYKDDNIKINNIIKKIKEYNNDKFIISYRICYN